MAAADASSGVITVTAEPSERSLPTTSRSGIGDGNGGS